MGTTVRLAFERKQISIGKDRTTHLATEARTMPEAVNGLDPFILVHRFVARRAFLSSIETHFDPLYF